MVRIDYQTICNNLLQVLPSRSKEVFSRRFGLNGKAPETLQSIGNDLGITRERVRQIEEDGLLELKPKLKKYQTIFQYFQDELKTTANLRREDKLLPLLASVSKFQNHTFFLLSLGENFQRFSETKDFYSLWTSQAGSLNLAQSVIDSFCNQLIKANHLLSLEDFGPSVFNLSSKGLLAYLEIAKKIDRDSEGLFGLRDWPEINPKGVKDKACLVLKKEKKPLHFREITGLINGLKFKDIAQSIALPQTVHNELIRDPRFVLVGRGLYALREWGYVPGVVREVISKFLKEAGKPLSKEEILEKVSEQRLVKETTVLLNLQNKKYFIKDPQGKYALKLT